VVVTLPVSNSSLLIVQPEAHNDVLCSPATTAKARAGRKLKQKSIKKGLNSGVGSRKPMRASWLGTALTGGEPAQSNVPASIVGILPQWQVSKNAPRSASGAGTSQSGPCYMCGKLGHYRKACPLLLGTNSSKSMQ